MERLPAGDVVSRRIVVWRHGRTSWNAAGRVQGQTDTPLDEVGEQQAREAAARLCSLRPGRIVSSDLRRARRTAEILGVLCGLDVHTDRGLREIAFGAREGMTWAEAWERFPDGMRAAAHGDASGIPGSESAAEAAERFTTVLELELGSLAAETTLVVVTHGGIARVGTAAFLGFPAELWRVFGGLSNCAWTVLEESVRDGLDDPTPAWRLREWNAGTLPEPVLSDEEGPGLGMPERNG